MPYEKKGKRLIDLLLDLGSDVDNVEKLKSDTEGFLKGYDLDDDEKGAVRQAVATGDPSGLQARLSDDDTAAHPNVNINLISGSP